jgi:hypothetical protein
MWSLLRDFPVCAYIGKRRATLGKSSDRGEPECFRAARTLA